MATGIVLSHRRISAGLSEPSKRAILLAFGLAALFVVLTRWPVARYRALGTGRVRVPGTDGGQWFPMHHTLFLTSARLLGSILRRSRIVASSCWTC